MHFDPSQTYLLGMVGNDTNRVRKLQGIYERFNQTHPMPLEHRWVHVAAMVHTGTEWHIIETDFPDGCVELTFEEWICNNDKRPFIEAMPHPMSVRVLRSYLGQPFPLKYQYAILKDPFGDVERDEPGILCSELIAYADGGVCGEPTRTLASHYQVYAVANSIPIETIYEYRYNDGR